MAKRSGAAVHPVVPAHLACRIGARARTGERNAWSAVAAIALGTFALVFSELIPVGLLADISGHLRVSVRTGGLMVVVPAVGGIVYDADGPGGALIVAAVIAALAALTLLSRAGAAISSPPAGIDGTAENALRTR